MAVMHQNRKNNILLGQNNNALTWLIILNAVAFVILFSIRLFYESHHQGSKEGDVIFNKEVLSWLMLPGDFKTLSSRPWTLVSFMFTHEGALQLLSTTLWLWTFGYILQDLAGNNKLIPLYIYGGIAGGLFYVAAVSLIPALSHKAATLAPLVSGSASVMAIAVATTFLSPGYRLLPMINGGIPLWVLTTIFVVIEYTSVAISNGGFAAAHLGAALLGIVFIHQLRRGRDWGAWMANFADWVDNLFNPEKKLVKEVPGQKLYYKATKKPYIKKTVVTQQRVDELLDKINQKGYHFLTDDEKEFLRKASEQDVY